MASTYKTPGVYVEEISVFPPSVAAVETAIPAFIGHTEKALKDGVDMTETPTEIRSLLEYEEYFGKARNEGTITVTINDTLDSSDNLIGRSVVASIGATHKQTLYYAMQMFFSNGGGKCYVVSVGGLSDNITKTRIGKGLDAIAKVDEPTILVMPEATSLNDGDYKEMIEKALNQCKTLQDRVAIIDTRDTGNITSDANNLRSNLTPSDIEMLKYAAAYYPNLRTSLNYQYREADVTVVHKTDKEGVIAAGAFDGLSLSESDMPHTTAEYNASIQAIGKLRVTLPPSSAVAGIYARVDSDRGVWKAPANVSVNSCLQPNTLVTHEDQKDLNVDTTAGKSINAIRKFTGKGILVWGARTLAGNDNEWRYVPVRRFFNMVEESVKKATERFVFEPNDANTWVKVRAMIENFLTLQWRAGALAGAKAEDAFFVKVGLGETMTALDILEGRMNVEIGMAVVRPAEFIILKFSHKMQES